MAWRTREQWSVEGNVDQPKQRTSRLPPSTATEAIWLAACRSGATWRHLRADLALLAEGDQYSQALEAMAAALQQLGKLVLPNLGLEPVAEKLRSRPEAQELVFLPTMLANGNAPTGRAATGASHTPGVVRGLRRHESEPEREPRGPEQSGGEAADDEKQDSIAKSGDNDAQRPMEQAACLTDGQGGTMGTGKGKGRMQGEVASKGKGKQRGQQLSNKPERTEAATGIATAAKEHEQSMTATPEHEQRMTATPEHEQHMTAAAEHEDRGATATAKEHDQSMTTTAKHTKVTRSIGVQASVTKRCSRRTQWEAMVEADENTRDDTGGKAGLELAGDELSHTNDDAKASWSCAGLPEQHHSMDHAGDGRAASRTCGSLDLIGETESNDTGCSESGEPTLNQRQESIDASKRALRMLRETILEHVTQRKEFIATLLSKAFDVCVDIQQKTDALEESKQSWSETNTEAESETE